MAKNERILIQHGRNEKFVLTRKIYLEPDEDLKQTVKLLSGVEEDIRTTYKEKINIPEPNRNIIIRGYSFYGDLR